MNSHYYYEKLLYGTTSLLASSLSFAGAILSHDEQQWVYVTFAVGILISCCMGLITRRDESMRVVVGRGLFSTISTVLLTRLLVYYFSALQMAKDDPLILGGIAAGVCIFAFTIGYGFIRGLDQEKFSLAKTIRDLLILILTKK